MEYKIGDKLECIHSHEWCQFEKGKIYTVTNVKPEYTTTISLEELLKQEPIFYTMPTTNKEEKTTMENKVTDEEILALFGVEYLYDNVFKQAKLLEVTEETDYEEWVKEDILILEEVPHNLSYDKVLELINVRVNNEFIKVQDRLARIRVKNELAQQEKVLKEERRKIYKELKKEFGKGETK